MQEAPVEDSSQSLMEYRLKRFYRLWCLKESMIKALDVQSGFDLKTIEFTIQDEEETEKVQLSSPSFTPSFPQHRGTRPCMIEIARSK